MAGSDPAPATEKIGAAGLRSNLALRIASAAVLAPVAIVTAYAGGWPFVAFWLIAAVAVLWEWLSLIGARSSRLVFPTAAAGLAAAALAAGLEFQLVASLIALLAAAAAAGVLAPASRRRWAAGGVVYAGVLLLGPLTLRADPQLGFHAVAFLFGVVWATDILGYFVGRSIGGPKLAPAISPGKTWTGALGGTVGAVAVACVYIYFSEIFTGLAAVALLAIVLSALSQCGDLQESWIKRQFDAKDAGRLIPGHGGVMDRLDGFWAAVLAATVIGLARGGLAAPAQGLLIW